ncbi:hypothetical protein JCM6882_006179 [Rhodosporidiobolus microsporus]
MLALRPRPPTPRTAVPILPRRHFSPSVLSAAPPRSSSIPPVVGSGGTYPRHLLLHTPHPASTWPSHLDSTSALYREMNKRWAKHPELSRIGFNFTDAGAGEVMAGQEWDAGRNKFEQPPEGQEEEVYAATLYPDFVPIPSLSISTLPAFESLFSSLPPAPSSSLSPSPSPAASPSTTPPRTHIFICTHGTRDCRCSDLGEPLYQALLGEIKRRKLGGELKGSVEESEVRIARIAHVGGHKFAGNALVYTEGKGSDWYGLLRASDAPTLLDHVLSPSPTPWFSRWRGRLGMTSEEVKDAYLTHEEAKGGKKAAGRKEETRCVLGDPVELVFVTFEGEEIRVKGYEGESLMETARRHDLPSILATCGGHCECATCHVHLPPSLSPSAAPSSPSTTSIRQPVPIPQSAPVPEMTDEEDEQLEFAIGADDDSRLACQIPVTKELGEWCAQGRRVKLPRY